MKENRERAFDERRLYRRRRRIRNQIIAYITVAIFFVAIVVGAVFGIRKLMGIIAERRQAEEVERQLEEAAAQAEQENAVVEPPAPIEEAPVEDVDWLEEIVETAIAPMPLEDRVAGLFIVRPEDITGVGTVITAGEGTQEALNKYAVGGLVYFDQNIKDKEQVKEMLSKTTMMSKYPIFLAVDEEGGSVRRVGSSGIEVTEVGDMADIGAAGDTMTAYNAGAEIASYLYELGFNLDFAPVADLANVEGSVMQGRAYGSDVSVVSSFVTSMVRGLREQKVSACLKHFPGMGSTTQDTHDGKVSTDRTAEQFWAEELAVFQAGIDSGANMIMVSHMAAPALTGDNEPSIFSRVLVTDILRNQMGFQGIVITDALSMSAISEYYGAEEAAIMAVLAGCDMLLMPEDYGKAYQGVLEAVRNGNIDEERINDSLRRIYRIKYADMVE